MNARLVERPSSPTIAALAAAVAAGEPAAVTDFWAHVTQVGAPLVEEAQDPGSRLLTFVWRADGHTDNVVVVGGPARWVDLAEDSMELLADTDVWFRTYAVPDDLVCGYQLSINDNLIAPDDVKDWVEREKTFRHDPLNVDVIDWPANPSEPTVGNIRQSLIALDGCADRTLTARRVDTPRGDVTAHQLASSALGNTRTVWVYRPADIDVSAPTPLMVLLDGWVWACGLPVADLLDNLIADGRIPPLTVVMIDSLDDETRVRELECNDRFVEFLSEQVLPWVRSTWAVTNDRGQVVVAGQSLGGLMGSFLALQAPESFGAVISQSGSFWWADQVEGEDLTEWFTALLAARPRTDVRLEVSVGRFEGGEMIPTNRRFRDALETKGYDFRYREFSGGHDWVAWRINLAEDLTAAFRAMMGRHADASPESSSS